MLEKTGNILKIQKKKNITFQRIPKNLNQNTFYFQENGYFYNFSKKKLKKKHTRSG